MRFVFYTNNVSPHQLPLAARLMARVGRGNFLYVMEEREWYGKVVETNLPIAHADDERAREWLENAEVMYMGGLRPVDLMERRVKRGLTTLYYSERWFKPVSLFDLRLLDCLIRVMVPGWVRMLVPWYRKMARRFVELANGNECVKFLPVGPWARQDFIRLGVRPDRLVDWGYFVASSVREVEKRGEISSERSRRYAGCGQRKDLAIRNVEEWMAGVTRETFDAALLRLVDEKVLANEYKFKRAGDRELAVAGARRFFDEFSRKILQLSDGRCVYFAPDARSKVRNANDLSRCWAEYAFHAVSNGGARIQGKGYNERWYNSHKAVNLNQIVETLRSERCFVRLRKDACADSILFAGLPLSGMVFDVVTRLDEFGNVEANLTEVTFEATTRNEKKLPRLVPLVEAVQTVVHHQTTAGSYPQDNNIISKSCSLRNGDSVLRILWVGRMIGWKRVDTIIRAVSKFNVQGSKFKVTLVGDGPERERLIKLAQRLFPGDVAIKQSNNLKSNNQTIAFLPRQPLEKVRDLMQHYDLYVLASDACEGWGAVVNEALEEGMSVIGTFEAGASAAILPRERLFPAGDWKALRDLVVKESRGALPECSIGPWTDDAAAEKVLRLGGWHG